MAVVRNNKKQTEQLNKVILHRHFDSKIACDISDHVPCSKYFSWKSIPDRILALFFLILLFPLIVILLVFVRLTSSGSGLFRQVRTGKNGRSFRMYKIRTMTENAEIQTGPIWAKIRDSRVTPVGRILRKLHLDELPQLINVLRGEMSLVGPRPERPEFVRMLADQISGYQNRLGTKPGITGLAQLNLPPDSDLDSVRRKLVLDLEYLQKASLFMDIRIICCTALRVFKLPERVSLRLFGLSRSVSHEQLERHMPPAEEQTSHRIHPASNISIGDECLPDMSESAAEFMKHFLDDIDMDDPKVRQCVQRTIHRACE